MNEKLIIEFKENARTYAEIDHSDKISVKNGNKAVKRMLQIAHSLNDKGDIDQLVSLLGIKENKIDLWVAHFLLDQLKESGKLVNKSLSVITEYANGYDIGAHGEKMWLQSWLKKN
jgi:hypothetical protein